MLVVSFGYNFYFSHRGFTGHICLYTNYQFKHINTMSIRRKKPSGPPDVVVITMLLLIAFALCFIVYKSFEEDTAPAEEEISEWVIDTEANIRA